MKPKEIVDLVFGPGGLLAKASPGYEARASQVELSTAIAETLDGGGSLLAEAPTGTGKSLAYLVPGTYWAASDNPHRAEQPRRLIVATANIALQEQLIAKDLPQLAAVLPWRFTFEVAKGMSNYVCKERLFDATAPTADPLYGKDAAMLAAIESWERETATGDLSELEEEPSPRVRLAVTTTSNECLGRKCPSAEECHARAARERYRAADVVVANYHLLLADVESGFSVLPPYSQLICDEANKLPDIARDAAGDRVSEAAISRLVKMGASAGASREELEGVETEARTFFGQASRYLDEMAPRIGEDGALTSEPLAVALEVLRPHLMRVSKSDDGTSEALKRAKMAGAALERLSDIQAFIRAASHPKGADQVFFIERTERGMISVISKLVDPSDYLRENIFDRCTAVVATSATLCTSPKDFDFIAKELGAESAEEMSVASPYDHARNMLVVVPKLPIPTSPAYAQAAAEAFAEVVRQANGRTLGLFTSWRGLEAAKNHLRRVWRGRVLVQGEMPRGKLIREFRSDVSSVLLGTESFWSGLDVQGESLSAVVIDRLPFPSPADPLMQVLAERDRHAWKTQQMPRALTMFRQGVGRLIRSRDDFGVVVLLDRRTVDKGYGRDFIRAIGKDVRVVSELDAIGAFLGRSAA